MNELITISRDDLAHHCAAWLDYQAGAWEQEARRRLDERDSAQARDFAAYLRDLTTSLTSHLWDNLAMISHTRTLDQIEARLTPEAFAQLDAALNKIAAAEAMLQSVRDSARATPPCPECESPLHDMGDGFSECPRCAVTVEEREE